MPRPWITTSFTPVAKDPLFRGDLVGWLIQTRYGDSGVPRQSRVVVGVIADNGIEVVPCDLADTLADASGEADPDEDFVPYRIR